MPPPSVGVPQWTRAVHDAERRRRWFAVGRSTDPDSRRAGAYAAARALVAADPALLLVWCSGPDDPAAVLAGVAEVADGVPVLGASAEAVLAPDGSGGPGGGVVVTALGGAGLSVSTAAEPTVTGRQRAAGAGVAGCAPPLTHRANQALLLVTNGDTDQQEALLAGAYTVVGAGVPIVGGAASVFPAKARTYVLHGREVLPDGVVAASIVSDGPLGVGVRHGYHRVGEPMIVTSSTGGLVHTLDDQPALRRYLDRLGAPAAAYRDPAVFAEFATIHPIGVRRRTLLELRDVTFGRHFDDMHLLSAGDIPEGGMVWLMAGDQDSSLAAAQQAGLDALAGLGGAEPIGAIAFDCVSRAFLLGEQGTRREVDLLSTAVGGAPVAGCYTRGEIGRVRGVLGYHNQTVVVLALG